MSHRTQSRRPWRRRLLRGGLALMALILVGLAVWLSHTYQPDDRAQVAYSQASDYQEGPDELIFRPDATQANGQALIFYPGAQVNPVAYTPLVQRLQQAGFTIVVVKMPLNLAILSPNAADRYLGKLPGIDTYYVMGHSMGGAMASAYASRHADQVAGLILLGAYPYKEFPADRTLIVYGSLNTSVADKVTTTVNVVVLEGGNHAQFGDYGPQAGDAVASLSADDQQAQTVAAIQAFVSGQSQD